MLLGPIAQSAVVPDPADIQAVILPTSAITARVTLDLTAMHALYGAFAAAGLRKGPTNNRSYPLPVLWVALEGKPAALAVALVSTGNSGCAANPLLTAVTLSSPQALLGR